MYVLYLVSAHYLWVPTDQRKPYRAAFMIAELGRASVDQSLGSLV